MRDRSEAELRQRLRGLGFPDEVQDSALNRLRELGYVDDGRFARTRARTLARAGAHGARAIVQKLVTVGIDPARAKREAAEAAPREGEAEVVRALLARRYPEALLAGGDPKVRARAFRFLLGRGFSMEVAVRVVGRGGDGAESSFD